MPQSLSYEWLNDPPHQLVAGDGPLAAALGQVLGGTMISLDALDEQVQQTEVEGGESYRLLEELHSVILIMPLSAGLADVARWVDQIWNLVVRFSSAEDQHDLRWVFVPVANDHIRLENGLKAILAVPKGTQLASHGYGVWYAQQSLEDLQGVWQSIYPTDLLTLRARRNRDERRRAFGTLLSALRGDNPDAVVSAAKEVTAQFPKSEEVLLDVFCRSPSHPNGGELRRWLTEVVTRGVTPHLCSSSRSKVEGWLLPELASPH